jgi:hypothetical protein
LSATVLVTVVGPDGLGADLAVPAEVPVAELLDGLRAVLRRFGGGPPAAPPGVAPPPGLPAVAVPPAQAHGGLPPDQVVLAPLGGAPLPRALSLAACGIGDGATLVLRDGPPPGPAPVEQRDPLVRPAGATPRGSARACSGVGWPQRWQGPPPRAGWPGRPTVAAALPEPWPLPVRCARALRAALAGPGWRGSVARGRRAWRDGGYESRLRAALAAAPLARCAVVGVLGATPRAGATTVTALLAAALAAGRPGRTVAVDASPGPGCLTELLAPGHDLFVDELVALLSHPMLTRQELGPVLARRGDLAVLAARLGTAAPEGHGWTLVLRALSAHATTVVADCGLGVSAGAHSVLAIADQLVLVADARARRAAAPADLLAGRGRAAVLLLNHAPGELEAAWAARWVAGEGGAVVLPADRAAASALWAAPARGAPAAPLGGVPLPAPWRRQADELAVLLAAQIARIR